MGWRKKLTDQIGHIPMMVYVEMLFKLPPADRIAVARELLEGTGRVVARMESFEETPEDDRNEYGYGFSDGWNRCREAMMQDDAT